MRYSRRTVAILGAIAALAIAGPGCGGGTDTQGTGGSNTGGSGGSGGSGGAGGGTGGTGGMTMSTGGMGGTGGGTGGTGGMMATDNGAQATDFVCAGGTAQSANYRMVFTLGQSTQNQGRTTSASYVMQGGLIGATGSLK